MNILTKPIGVVGNLNTNTLYEPITNIRYQDVCSIDNTIPTPARKMRIMRLAKNIKDLGFNINIKPDNLYETCHSIGKYVMPNVNAVCTLNNSKKTDKQLDAEIAELVEVFKSHGFTIIVRDQLGAKIPNGRICNQLIDASEKLKRALSTDMDNTIKNVSNKIDLLNIQKKILESSMTESLKSLKNAQNLTVSASQLGNINNLNKNVQSIITTKINKLEDIMKKYESNIMKLSETRREELKKITNNISDVGLKAMAINLIDSALILSGDIYDIQKDEDFNAEELTAINILLNNIVNVILETKTKEEGEKINNILSTILTQDPTKNKIYSEKRDEIKKYIGSILSNYKNEDGSDINIDDIFDNVDDDDKKLEYNNKNFSLYVILGAHIIKGESYIKNISEETRKKIIEIYKDHIETFKKILDVILTLEMKNKNAIFKGGRKKYRKPKKTSKKPVKKTRRVAPKKPVKKPKKNKN